MAESFLEEQLKRIKKMSEQMSRVTTELSNELARDREKCHQGPIDEVRDLRTYAPLKKSRERSDDRAGNARRHTARDVSRRRRR